MNCEGCILRRVITFARFTASVGALVALIIAGGKLSDHNYNIIVESWVMGACLVTLFSIAIYNLSKQKN